MRLVDWPCSTPMRPIGSSAPISMDSDVQHGLARFLSVGHLTYGVKWAQCTGLLFQSPSLIPDEILWRIAVYWPDLGNHWHEASWRLHPVDDSRSASCLPDLIHSTYVLVMPGLLNEMVHRPHGLLEVTQGDMCHVRAHKDQFAYPARVPQGILSARMAYGAVCWHPQSSSPD